MPQSVRTTLAAALGALIVVAIVISIRPAAAAPAPGTTSDPTVHAITVNGTSTVTLVPDVAVVGLGVSATDTTVEKVRSRAGTVMTAMIAAMKAKGVADRDITTTGIDLSPQYEICSSGACSSGPGRITGYTMTEQVRVTVRNLDAAGNVIDAATAAGATLVSGLSFQVGDPAKARADALTAAVAAARAKANAIAAAAGVSISGVISVTENSIGGPIAYGAFDAAAPSKVATPVSPGTQDVQATVTVVYAIG